MFDHELCFVWANFLFVESNLSEVSIEESWVLYDRCHAWLCNQNTTEVVEESMGILPPQSSPGVQLDVIMGLDT